MCSTYWWCGKTYLMYLCVQNAGGAVKRATEALVREAQQKRERIHYEETTNTVTVNKSMVTDIAKVILVSLGYNTNIAKVTLTSLR